jgi:hypothetical protein
MLKNKKHISHEVGSSKREKTIKIIKAFFV